MRGRLTSVVLAFAIVYVVWGSTYLAIRIMVSGLPPFLSGGLRFLIAAAVMFAIAWWRGDTAPRHWAEWRNLLITGLFMLGVGNGVVTWAERWVPSNQAALVVASAALWIAWFGTWGSKGDRLDAVTIVGLLLGFGGVVVLVGGASSDNPVPLPVYAILLIAPLAWAAGSIYSKRFPVETGAMMAAAIQTLGAGVVLTLIGLLNGDVGQWQWAARPLWALAYLAIFGSCLGYGAYFWLVRQVSPALLSTYAYVNPAIAILLGWLVLGETLSGAQLAGSAVILLAVLVVTWASRYRRPVPQVA